MISHIGKVIPTLNGTRHRLLWECAKRHEIPLAERDYVDAMKLAERFKIPLIWPLQQLW